MFEHELKAHKKPKAMSEMGNLFMRMSVSTKFLLAKKK